MNPQPKFFTYFYAEYTQSMMSTYSLCRLYVLNSDCTYWFLTVRIDFWLYVLISDFWQYVLISDCTYFLTYGQYVQSVINTYSLHTESYTYFFTYSQYQYVQCAGEIHKNSFTYFLIYMIRFFQYCCFK